MMETLREYLEKRICGLNETFIMNETRLRDILNAIIEWSEQASKAEKTLRDYFAAAALQGLLADRQYYPVAKAVPDAWQLADLMLEARKK